MIFDQPPLQVPCNSTGKASAQSVQPPRPQSTHSSLAELHFTFIAFLYYTGNIHSKEHCPGHQVSDQGGIIIFTSCHPRFSIKYLARKSVIRAHTIFRPKERDSRTNHISPKERDSRTYQATFLHVL